MEESYTMPDQKDDWHEFTKAKKESFRQNQLKLVKMQWKSSQKKESARLEMSTQDGINKFLT